MPDSSRTPGIDACELSGSALGICIVDAGSNSSAAGCQIGLESVSSCPLLEPSTSGTTDDCGTSGAAGSNTCGTDSKTTILANSNANDPEPLPTQVNGPTGRLTNGQATDLAEYLGYRSTNYRSHGQRIFTNGKTYIVQDVDSHRGGTWKIGDSVDAVRSRSGRTATTDALLTPLAQ